MTARPMWWFLLPVSGAIGIGSGRGPDRMAILDTRPRVTAPALQVRISVRSVTPVIRRAD